VLGLNVCVGLSLRLINGWTNRQGTVVDALTFCGVLHGKEYCEILLWNESQIAESSTEQETRNKRQESSMSYYYISFFVT
jgi:hypothetical protein